MDDAGRPGGLDDGASFVVLGDQNADPEKGDSYPGAIDRLLSAPRVRDPLPASATNGTDTADFGPRVGRLRVDYVLPSDDLEVIDSGVFWPAPGEPGADAITASDHRLVWVDLRV